MKDYYFFNEKLNIHLVIHGGNKKDAVQFAKDLLKGGYEHTKFDYQIRKDLTDLLQIK